ncbi:unnamed protein product [Parnassius apollo]|uniref:(apollo) hypothetical protein n=1 Tax=Parnassius apollo TaxID=110799 RepID=A0A8S3W2C9_PARAO|nr:unnamed protein product [Parnassius apollo]
MSFQYSNVQYTEMVRTLAQCGDNVALACRTFNQRFEAASENNNNYRINNDVDRGPFDKPTKIVEDNYVTDIIEDDETPRSILDEFTGELINKNEEREDEKKEVYSEPTLQNNLIERSLTPQPSTSKQVTYSTVSIISNVSLTEYLKQNLPLSPKRQGKRQIERLPFALTSDQYVERIKAKQLKKIEEEAAKEERKRLREEKKKEKENSIPKKKIKKKSDGKSKTKIIEEDICKENTENTYEVNEQKVFRDFCSNLITSRVIECNQCKKRFHLNCIPSYHRLHVPVEDEDQFLCHMCYRESNTDSSDGDCDAMFSSACEEARKQGFGSNFML